ncbi:MAG: hypothetical protein CMD88_00360 [Gammaproteobacteria bacterium]|nr:hypothetical protein [Gammaproteobacteria bacterium]|tara:strand:- start:143534 stop:144199 length:666 start_codon:yes stop_codon:yes gene_type:complete
MIDFQESTKEQLLKNIKNLSSELANKYEIYIDALFSWQQTNNIIGIKSKEYFIQREINDCLLIKDIIPDGQMIDIGTGGGIPGIIFAISNMTNKYILLERSQNYLNFLEQIKIRLDLKNVVLVNEDFYNYKTTKKIDAIVLKNFTNKKISHLPYIDKFLFIMKTISKNIGCKIPVFMITGSNSLELLDNSQIKSKYINNINIKKINTTFFKTSRYLVESIS